MLGWFVGGVGVLFVGEKVALTAEDVAREALAEGYGPKDATVFDNVQHLARARKEIGKPGKGQRGRPKGAKTHLRERITSVDPSARRLGGEALERDVTAFMQAFRKDLRFGHRKPTESGPRFPGEGASRLLGFFDADEIWWAMECPERYVSAEEAGFEADGSGWVAVGDGEGGGGGRHRLKRGGVTPGETVAWLVWWMRDPRLSVAARRGAMTQLRELLVLAASCAPEYILARSGATVTKREAERSVIVDGIDMNAGLGVHPAELDRR